MIENNGLDGMMGADRDPGSAGCSSQNDGTTRRERARTGRGEEFERLWSATPHRTQPRVMQDQPAGRETVRTGEAALPLMPGSPGRYALHRRQTLSEITGEDPAPRALWGRIREMDECWRRRGLEHGYLKED